MQAGVRCATPSKGRMMWYALCSGAIIAVGSGLLKAILENAETSAGAAAGWAFWAIALLLGARFAGKSRKANLPNAAQVVMKAQKFPILYLRPFQRDRKTSYWFFVWSSIGALGILVARTLLTTPEARLIGQLWRQLECPVVAVANPSSDPDLYGAARVWISHELWQQKVQEFIRYAPVVLLAVGETKGSIWELEEVIRSMDPRKLVILVPKGDRATFMTVLNRVLPKRMDDLDRTTCFIAFDEDWFARQASDAEEILGRFHIIPCIES